MAFRDYTEILFKAGDILSVKMLDETYRFPREFLHHTFFDYSNGVIRGLDFVERVDGVYLTSGVVKVDDKYYIMSNDLNLDNWLKNYKPRLQESAMYGIYMVSDDVLTNNDEASGIMFKSRLTLQVASNIPNNSLLLAKYKVRLDKGITLPKLQLDNQSSPFGDFSRGGLLQLLNCEYSHPKGETTFHPLIFRAIGEYLAQKKMLSPYDFSLLMEIQNHGIVSKKSLMSYICVSKNCSNIGNNPTREILFKEVVECVQKPFSAVLSQTEILETTQEEEEDFGNKLI